MLAVFQDLRAVDEYVAHADRVLMRVLERGSVGDSGWIEDDNVGEHALPDEAALLQLEVRGRQSAQPVDRLLERNHVLLSHVHAEEPGEVAVGARMGGRLRERRLWRHG